MIDIYIKTSISQEFKKWYILKKLYSIDEALDKIKQNFSRSHQITINCSFLSLKSNIQTHLHAEIKFFDTNINEYVPIQPWRIGLND